MLRWWKRLRADGPARDEVWASEAAKLAGIVRSLQRLDAGQGALLAPHFPHTLRELAVQLDQHGLRFDLDPAPRGATPAPIRITLAASLRAGGEVVPGAPDQLLVIAPERHPLRARDDGIVEWASARGVGRGVIFHVSLEDPVLRLFVGEQTLRLLERTGMSETESISSPWVSRALRQAQDRTAQRLRGDLPADSAARWLEINLAP